MKTSILSLLVSAATLCGASSFACQPPPNLWSTQGGQLNTILAASKVRQQILTLGPGSSYSRGIRNIAYASGAYTIETANGCRFVARVEYTSPSTPGMCPSVKGVAVSGASCPKTEN